MAAMNMVSAGGFSGVSFHLSRCPHGVASVLREKTPNFGSRGSKLDHLTVAEDSKIPKMPAINPFQALVHPQTQKNYPAWIVNPQPQLLRIHLFW